MAHRLLQAGAVAASGAYLAISLSTILHRQTEAASYRLASECRMLPKCSRHKGPPAEHFGEARAHGPRCLCQAPKSCAQGRILLQAKRLPLPRLLLLLLLLLIGMLLP